VGGWLGGEAGFFLLFWVCLDPENSAGFLISHEFFLFPY